MTCEPPYLSDEPGKTARMADYSLYTPIMKTLARLYEDRKDLSKPTLLVFVNQWNGEIQGHGIDQEEIETVSLLGFIREANQKTNNNYAALFVLSLKEGLDDQLRKYGIDPTTTHHWPDDMINCTMPRLSSLGQGEEVTSHVITREPDILKPERREDIHRRMERRGILGLVDGGKADAAKDKKKSPRLSSLSLVSRDAFEGMPDYLKDFRAFFSEAFANKHRYALLFVHTDLPPHRKKPYYAHDAYNTPYEVENGYKEMVHDKGYRCVLALSTAQDFMEQLQAGSFISAEHPDHNTVITPGIFPDDKPPLPPRRIPTRRPHR